MLTKPHPVHEHTSHSLRFPQLDRTITGKPGDTIFQSARLGGVRIVGACGGRGTCGACVVRVVSGSVALTGDDAEVAAPGGSSRTKAKKWLRACKVKPQGDCEIEIAPRSLAPIVRAEVDTASTLAVAVDPMISSFDVTVEAPTLAEPSADSQRLQAAMPVPFTSIDLAAAQRLPGLLRKEKWTVRVHQRGERIVDVTTAGCRTLGLAVDLGTTNIAGFLMDMESGAQLAGLGIENPQSPWGADLISRINYAIKTDGGAGELRRAGLAGINALAHDLCRAVGAESRDIVDATICGNTAMHHLLLGLPADQLGRAPFVAATRDALDVGAREAELEICPGANVHLAANIGGFVGGDHVTALLATEAQWSAGGLSIVMDIGTNTEISLIGRGHFLSASCPSGPALEGGHIACGMRAAEGAIERVDIQDGRIAVRTIGGKEAIGLCGSGVLDAICALHKAGILDDGGRLSRDHPDVGMVGGKRAAMLAPDVYFTQDDVRAVQLAKAAIRTGVEMLLHEAGLAEDDIDNFIIAGAFGAYIDVASAIATGLLPDLPRERFRQVGNAAGLGVRQMLVSKKARMRARELAQTANYVELSSRSGFQKVFIKNIGINNAGSNSR